MAAKQFTYLIGYIGFIPQYHTIFTPEFYLVKKKKIHPKHKQPRPQQNLMLSNRRRFFKIYKPSKKDTSYKGVGKNYK